MDRFLSEEFRRELLEKNQNNGIMVGLCEDGARASRWKHLFNAPSDALTDEEKAFYEMNMDPVLKHYGVDAAGMRHRRWATEVMLDNMVQQAVSEQHSKGLLETTTTSNVAAFTTWALPMVKKYLPQNFLFEIVPTYPMNQPTGYVFTADAQYGSAGGSYASGTSMYDSFDATYAADAGECGATKEVNLNISSSTITAISKKLKGVWSIEAAQDLQAYHRMVLENEVVKVIGDHINREINRYGINQLVSNASTTTNWNSTQPMAATNAWSNAVPKQFQESLWDSIEDANKAIKDAQYVDANFILCGTTFASRLRKLNGFRLAFSGDPVRSDIVTGPNLFGTLNGRYRLYEDVDFAPDKALIGHKPASWMYTGAVFCPYVPVWRTPVVHTTTLCPGVGYLSRFGFKVIDGDFYGIIVVY